MVTDGVSEALEDGVSPATRLVSIVRPLVQAGLDDVVAAVLSATSVKQEASLAPPDDQTVVAFRLRGLTRRGSRIETPLRASARWYSVR